MKSVELQFIDLYSIESLWLVTLELIRYRLDSDSDDEPPLQYWSSKDEDCSSSVRDTLLPECPSSVMGTVMTHLKFVIMIQ